jgi:hypothetical protein
VPHFVSTSLECPDAALSRAQRSSVIVVVIVVMVVVLDDHFTALDVLMMMRIVGADARPAGNVAKCKIQTQNDAM